MRPWSHAICAHAPSSVQGCDTPSASQAALIDALQRARGDAGEMAYVNMAALQLAARRRTLSTQELQRAWRSGALPTLKANGARDIWVQGGKAGAGRYLVAEEAAAAVTAAPASGPPPSSRSSAAGQLPLSSMRRTRISSCCDCWSPRWGAAALRRPDRE